MPVATLLVEGVLIKSTIVVYAVNQFVIGSSLLLLQHLKSPLLGHFSWSAS